MGRLARRLASLCAGLFALLAAVERFAPAAAASFRVGDFTFSDELGGFEILGVTGTGTTDDPFVIHERLYGPGEATIVIRRHRTPTGYAFVGDSIRICVRKVIVNATGRAWEGFDLELQEIRGQASVHGDGLSFDQLARFEDVRLAADRFAELRWRAEPYDRIHLRQGSVDPGGVLIVDFAITDVTPTPVFYLRQDPLLLTAEGPPGPRRTATAPLAAGRDQMRTP
ncbi:MAG: hypothetical protein GC150_10400 [Rhizobiales bacterium]|nr:hypothetical protein [Hyphomicrobiales bacterium]